MSEFRFWRSSGAARLSAFDEPAVSGLAVGEVWLAAVEVWPRGRAFRDADRDPVALDLKFHWAKSRDSWPRYELGRGLRLEHDRAGHR